MVSVTAFIKFHIFAAAKACTGRMKASFMEAGVEKTPITPMLMENKVNSIRKPNPQALKFPPQWYSTDRWEKFIDLMHKIIVINMKT